MEPIQAKEKYENCTQRGPQLPSAFRSSLLLAVRQQFTLMLPSVQFLQGGMNKQNILLMLSCRLIRKKPALRFVFIYLYSNVMSCQ